MPRIAVTGTTGRVGRALARRLATDHEVIELPRTDWDFSDPSTVERVGGLGFDLLVHPAAVTSLERCEEEPELARRVNAEAPAALAALCRRRGAAMIHFSTDYVLEGSSPGLQDESAAVGPLSEYARTKLAGEEAVLAGGGCVLRVSWVHGPERPAFPEQVVGRALAGQPLAAIDDKTSLPCHTGDLAEWVAELIDRGPGNELLHACNPGEPVSWKGMAEWVVEIMLERGALPGRPEMIAQHLDEVPFFKVRRPRHTAMATGRLAQRLGRPLRPWQEAMREHVTVLLDDLLSR
jgi:dTDP-4-dehydrorhamnose reductase